MTVGYRTSCDWFVVHSVSEFCSHLMSMLNSFFVRYQHRYKINSHTSLTRIMPTFSLTANRQGEDQIYDLCQQSPGDP